jgi:hypothetical protein
MQAETLPDRGLGTYADPARRLQLLTDPRLTDPSDDC